MRRILITDASSGIGLAIAAHKDGQMHPTSAEALPWKRFENAVPVIMAHSARRPATMV